MTDRIHLIIFMWHNYDVLHHKEDIYEEDFSCHVLDYLHQWLSAEYCQLFSIKNPTKEESPNLWWGSEIILKGHMPLDQII